MARYSTAVPVLSERTQKCDIFGVMKPGDTTKLLLLFAVILTTSSGAFAQEEPPVSRVASCIQQHTEGQEQRLEGSLLRARALFEGCANPVCPEQIRQDCLQWRGAAEQTIPSLHIVVELDGVRTSDALVRLDGVLLSPDDWSSIEVNPGLRTIQMEVEGEPTQELQVVARHGERNIPVVGRFSTTAETEPTTLPITRPSPTRSSANHSPRPLRLRRVTWGLTTLAAANFVGFVVVGSLALGKVNEGESCRPFCDERFVGQLEREVLAADIMLGAAVTLGIGALITGLMSRRQRLQEIDVALGDRMGHIRGTFRW